ncbi:MAG: DUF2849 domain-containing protein [Rhodospirillaceae bacterium]
MARPAEGLAAGFKAITANRLDSGAVVWLGAGDRWEHRLAAAARFEGGEAEAALERVKADVAAGVVVDPYAVEVSLVEGIARPVRPREQIRSLGPSVRTDLGIQAGQQQ